MTWFRDKVLPNIVAAALGSLATAVFIFAGGVTSGAIKKYSQLWLPFDAVLLVANEGSCPKDGWKKVGPVHLVTNNGYTDFLSGEFSKSGLTTSADLNGNAEINLDAVVMIVCKRDQ